MKKVGIACDNYKVPGFEQMLKEGKFVYTATLGLTKEVASIIVMCPEARVNELATLIHKTEAGFSLNRRKN